MCDFKALTINGFISFSILFKNTHIFHNKLCIVFCQMLGEFLEFSGRFCYHIVVLTVIFCITVININKCGFLIFYKTV